MSRIKALFGVAESFPDRPQMDTPVVTGHWERADRIQDATGVANPLVNGPIGLHEPLDFSDSVGRRHADEVERIEQVIWRQPQQRTGDRFTAERGEHELAKPPKVRRRQPIQFVADHALDL